MDVEDFDYNRIIIKPLYFGLISNIIIPMALLLVCYYLESKKILGNMAGDFASTLFYIFAVVSIAQAGLALWWRTVVFKKPMIKRQETFEHDFTIAVLERSKPIFLLIAAISIYGYIFFFVTAQFKEAVFFVVFSFVVFQVVRPRIGFLKSAIKTQIELTGQGKYQST